MLLTIIFPSEIDTHNVVNDIFIVFNNQFILPFDFAIELIANLNTI